jgi:hypothetical protein
MKQQFITSLLVSLIFLVIGFTLLHYELIGYGISFFVFLPFILGYILARSNYKWISLVGLIVALMIFLGLLITGNLEGMVCVLMSLPLIVVFVTVGVMIHYLFGKYQKENKDNHRIKSSIVPLILFSALGVIEHKLTENDQFVNEVKSEIILPYSSLEVYETIKSVDTLDGEKPFLMQLDLPIPQKCILADERVGGIRTCYFEGGKIVERITALEKGKVLKMDVIDYQLTGRKWLGFKEAIYYFEDLGNQRTKMTRITTYTSELYPRFYWQPLESIGIEQEHAYVFSNLKRDLIDKYGRR